MAEFSRFDVAHHLDSPETIAAYLNEAFETNDDAVISQAIGTVARVKGEAMTDEASLARESLRKSIDDKSEPEFDTVQKVLAALGVKLIAKPIDDPKAA